MISIRRVTTKTAFLAFFSALIGFASTHAAAQQRAVPKDDYYAAFNIYYNGDYNRAHRAFSQAGSSGIRSVNGRWVDSICYHTMMGECLYRMGDLAGALKEYTAALQLFHVHQTWLLRIEFPATLTASGRSIRKPPTWAASTRGTRPARVPDLMSSRQGGTDINTVLQQGGVVSNPMLFSLGVKEIVRCTALAIRRRMEIMGPVCRYDPLSNQLVSALSNRPSTPNHWSQAWISCQLGLAYASVGKTQLAAAELQKSLVVGPGLDHELTSMALVELGKLAFREQKYDAAAAAFMEATITGAVFSQYDVMEEAFRWATKTHMVTGRGGVFAPLADAATWSARGARPLESSVLLSAAENAAAYGDANSAAALLKKAQSAMRRREFSAGEMGARAEYLAAVIHFQTGNLAQGNTAFADVMKYYRRGSKRLFQVDLADRMFIDGLITQRNAGILFDEVLRDPTAEDWALDTIETLAVLMTPHLGPMEHWFELALNNKDTDKALLISDRIRRHKFYSTLPMGGRLTSLRWILEAPEKLLSTSAQLQRKTLLAKYPAYAELGRQALTFRAELAAMPLVPGSSDETRQQSDLLAKLAETSGRQEEILLNIALGRDHSDFVFPPHMNVSQVQEKLSEGQVVLAFQDTQRGFYGFMIDRDKYSAWRIEGASKVRGNVSKMLREMGNYDGNQALGTKELQNEAWKEPAESLLKSLTGNPKADAWNGIKELVIIPDGILWYLPFEAMPINDGTVTMPMISKVRVRYAPLLALAVPAAANPKPLASTAVVTGKLFPRDEDQVSAAAFDALANVLPGCVRLPAKVAVPGSLVATICDRLVVLDDFADAGTYNWSPLPSERVNGSSLADWMNLPFGAPEQVVLPGFHTPAENALRRGGDGNDVFLTVCGLMASGTRTILLSRWRTGGQSSFDLVREFTQELPHTSASEAWQRSVQLVMNTELDDGREPRLKPLQSDSPPKAEHPFFWSGYVLVDTGRE